MSNLAEPWRQQRAARHSATSDPYPIVRPASLYAIALMEALDLQDELERLRERNEVLAQANRRMAVALNAIANAKPSAHRSIDAWALWAYDCARKALR